MKPPAFSYTLLLLFASASLGQEVAKEKFQNLALTATKQMGDEIAQAPCLQFAETIAQPLPFASLPSQITPKEGGLTLHVELSSQAPVPNAIAVYLINDTQESVSLVRN